MNQQLFLRQILLNNNKTYNTLYYKYLSAISVKHFLSLPARLYTFFFANTELPLVGRKCRLVCIANSMHVMDDHTGFLAVISSNNFLFSLLSLILSYPLNSVSYFGQFLDVHVENLIPMSSRASVNDSILLFQIGHDSHTIEKCILCYRTGHSQTTQTLLQVVFRTSG